MTCLLVCQVGGVDLSGFTQIDTKGGIPVRPNLEPTKRCLVCVAVSREKSEGNQGMRAAVAVSAPGRQASY
jgi:hypothetical protein